MVEFDRAAAAGRAAFDPRGHIATAGTTTAGRAIRPIDPHRRCGPRRRSDGMFETTHIARILERS